MFSYIGIPLYYANMTSTFLISELNSLCSLKWNEKYKVRSLVVHVIQSSKFKLSTFLMDEPNSFLHFSTQT